MRRFIQKLEEKYALKQKEAAERPDFRFSARSRNYKQNLENSFKHLNGLNEITSKELYDQALKIFNVEIKKSGRGHIVFITDGNGNPARFLIRLSDFKERPKFYVSEKMGNSLHQSNQGIDKFQLAQLARDLNRLIETKSTFQKRELNPKLKKKPKVRQKHF